MQGDSIEGILPGTSLAVVSADSDRGGGLKLRGNGN